MGCDFTFINESSNVLALQQRGDNTFWLWRNINRSSTQHLINVILTVIDINKWKSTDKICIECCCASYTFQNNILFDNYDLCLIVNDNICQSNDCPVCTSL